MDMTSIVEAATLTNRVVSDKDSPEMLGRKFDEMLFEILLKESGLANVLENSAGKEWAVLGDHFIQMLASQLAQEVDMGSGRLLAAKHDLLAKR